jgi:hypothetical protein
VLVPAYHLFLVPTLCVGTDSLDAPRPGSTQQSLSTPDAERLEWRHHAERRNEPRSVPFRVAAHGVAAYRDEESSMSSHLRDPACEFRHAPAPDDRCSSCLAQPIG